MNKQLFVGYDKKNNVFLLVRDQQKKQILKIISKTFKGMIASLEVLEKKGKLPKGRITFHNSTLVVEGKRLEPFSKKNFLKIKNLFSFYQEEEKVAV